MPAKQFTIETLWREENFKPTPNQQSETQSAAGPHARKEAAFKQYLEEYGTELEQQDWLSSELEVGSMDIGAA